MQFTHLEDFIHNLYQSMNITIPKEISIRSIASCLSIKLRFWDESSQATRRNKKPWIFINETLNSQMQWQDFGHELCHVLQHAGNQRILPVEFRLYQEIKSDNFMYQFCVPTFMLQEYQIANYFNIEDGVPIIARDFNVTEEFARKRLIQYRNKIQQAISDEEHRRYMESRYPKAPPYSEETNKILDQLNLILKKRGVKI